MANPSATDIAVVVPAYNAASTIGESLASVLRQTVPCQEIVVVDDGSSDSTREIVQAFSTRVRLICTPNQGAAAARNRGVQETSAPLIAFLDADDVWHPQKLEVQTYWISKYKDAVACHSTFRNIDSYDVIWEKLLIEKVQVTKRGLRDVFRSPYLGTPTVTVHRAAFEEVHGFNTSLRTAEDVDLWLRIAELGTILKVESPLAGVRQLDTGISRSSGREGDFNNLSVIDLFVDRNPEFSVANRQLIAKMRHDIRCRIGAAYLGEKRWADAQSVLQRALLEYPVGGRSAYLLLKSILRRT